MSDCFDPLTSTHRCMWTAKTHADLCDELRPLLVGFSAFDSVVNGVFSRTFKITPLAPAKLVTLDAEFSP